MITNSALSRRKFKVANVYYDKDADLKYLQNKTVAIIGYGNQGRSQALNLRDSGVKVIVGNVENDTWKRAKADDFEVYTIAEAAKKADIMFILIPDEIMPQVFEAEILPNLEKNNLINFASGYNVHYDFINLPSDMDVTLIAPRMIGKGVRDRFVEGTGFPSLIAVHQDASGQAKQLLLALAKGIGTTKVGAFESSFEEETVVDLFGEQVMGGFKMFNIRASFELLVEAGYNPEAILLEFYLSGEGVESQKAAMEMGLWGQLKLHSTTSQYGHQTRGAKAASEESKKALKEILDDIESGRFAREWKTDQMTGYPVFKSIWKKNLQHSFIKAETELFEKMGRKKHEQ
jgi:ketol-acid reductoisomerase